ncbi:MAG TPA: Stp1/IreP family PP2C-type Ser/Thr phosphatase [Nitrosomonas sp.]|nr:Stp1/IreP family PP2C-type Ser/Thr phosphatase [Nitrosomonas sp.]HMW21394.1 Stp1/IreP family PP2C-type Ser/Thr phosphatase [Nitrosomonas sp.]HMW69265.1 Stp1/IreP family PP2C-type Ser/Thr phosphatase [Nitrosomonas sp.]HMY62346.1 Stp1/IreP family PP2C-type Ser/Thr phosphatase [Nitrosomonas sp.]HMY90927.1 Stp1/IreP family PP2C-type Ser/Thr phosphatase [Nitrosomonas sp.]
MASYFHLEIGSLSDTGRCRSVNQDCLGIDGFDSSHNFLAIVADGMGGHQAGDIASRIAVDEIKHHYFVLLKKQSPDQALRQAFQEANTAILTRAQQFPEYQRMGTTLVVLSLNKSAAYFASTGDSRLYLIRENAIQQLTRDHTLVAEMLRKGLLSVEQAKNHPDKHIITHAVGTQEKVFVDTSDLPLLLKYQDCFLLCSDGLYDLVSDAEMLDYATQYPVQQACQKLVDLANTRGGYDNISVIIIKILEKPGLTNEIPITQS